MGKITLYHGSPEKVVTPKFGLGEEKHDYGKGFYLTESLELAKEWAVYRPNVSNGWVRENMRKLIDSDRNRVTKVFSTLL